MFQQSKELEDNLRKERRKAEERDAERRAMQLGFPYLNLVSTKVPTELKALELVKEEDARRAMLVPLQIMRKKVVVASFNPSTPDAEKIISELKKKYEVQILVCSLTSLDHALSYYQYISDAKDISGSIEINEDNLRELQEKIKVMNDLSKEIASFKSPYTSQVLEIILAGALAMKSSDAHLEPGEETNSFRLRIDGLLHTAYENFTSLVYRALITRIKLLSGLKLNIHNEAQDGRFTIKLKDRDIEVRTSVIPSEYGETVVLRLLDPLALKTELTDLGWRHDDLEIVKKVVAEPNGLILNTGPTGSGKTTTLYAFLKNVTRSEIKIITIEDPIEYHLKGISQTQVNVESGYTFASGLRSILRQDPDIVLVGEVRDKETAEIALNAALTGHLVFSTLHTNDAVGAIPRLLDLGAKPQTLGPALSLVIAQRLVRTLCKECRQEVPMNDSMEKDIREFIKSLPERVDRKSYEEFGIWKAKGCPSCGGLGYRGRTSIFELFVVSQEIEGLIYNNPTEIDLKNAARAQGMVWLQEDGMLKVLKGITTIEEVERLTGKLEWIKNRT
jgi:type IV pilus assembly protein PilB